MTIESNSDKIKRWGITVPFEGIHLTDQIEIFKELADLGYTDIWSAEADGSDAFVPLALAAIASKELRLGTAVVPVYTRGPALLAMQVDTIAEMAPDRFVLGIGTSSNVIVSKWNDIEFKEPYQKTKDTIQFLKAVLEGQKVRNTYKTFKVDGFKLGRNRSDNKRSAVPIAVAALRPKMQELSVTIGDGIIMNWLTAEDVTKVMDNLKTTGVDLATKEIVARIFVMPTEDESLARNIGRYIIGAYLNVPVYRMFHEWLGRSNELQDMWDLWEKGQRQEALAAIPDSLVDRLVLHGSPEECKEKISLYVQNGIKTPVIALIPVGIDQVDSLRKLAPDR